MAMASPSGDDAPTNPQNAPGGAQQGPPGGQQGPGSPGGGGAEIVKLIQNIGGGLAHIQQVIQQTQGTTPQEKQMIGQILEMYTQLVKSLDSQGPPSPQGPQGGAGQGQTSPMEVGGNSGAQPAM